jgi:hypothetical protein
MKHYVLNHKVLVLNSNWSPVNITIVRDAIGMVYAGSAFVVLHKNILDKFDEKEAGQKYQNLNYHEWVSVSENMNDHQEDFIRSGRFRHFKPRVIRLSNCDKVPNYFIRLSRRSLYDRDDGICQYCGKHVDYDNFTIDHVIPRAKGGTTTWNNIVCSCKKCNFYKDSRSLRDTGFKLIKKPEKPSADNFTIVYKKENDVWADFLNHTRRTA